MKNQYKTLVFIHGMGGDTEQWDDWPKSFSGRFHSHHIPAPGAYNPKALPSLGVHEYAQRAIDMMRASMAPDLRYILIGHSSGGLIAQKMAEMDSGRVRGLILLASDPPKQAGKVPFNRRMLGLNLAWAMLTGRPFTFNPGQARFICGMTSGVKFHPESGKLLREVVLGQVGIDKDKIACPVAVIAAKGDPLLPVALQDSIARYYYHRTEEFLRLDGGHMFHMDPCFNAKVIAAVRGIIDKW